MAWIVGPDHRPVVAGPSSAHVFHEAPMIYIENEGALFRGFSRSWPQQVWSPKKRQFVPYTGKTPKGIEWGEEISAAQAIGMMMGADSSATHPRRKTPRRRS
jgi:hypothetical protein